MLGLSRVSYMAGHHGMNTVLAVTVEPSAIVLPLALMASDRLRRCSAVHRGFDPTAAADLLDAAVPPAPMRRLTIKEINYCVCWCTRQCVLKSPHNAHALEVLHEDKSGVLMNRIDLAARSRVGHPTRGRARDVRVKVDRRARGQGVVGYD